MFKGMAILCASVAFVGCSRDVFDEDLVKNNLKEEYKTSFERKYGAIDPNQSWDFTNYSKASKSGTRDAASSVTCEFVYLFNEFKTLVKHDKDEVENHIDYTTTSDLKPWNPNLAVTLYPAFSHALSGVKYSYVCIGIYDNGTITNLTADVNVKNGWYDAQLGGLNHNSGRKINSKALQTGTNTYWVAYPLHPHTESASQADKDANKQIMANISDYKIQYYKEIIVNGDKYWCFDCNNDGNYSDLICLVDAADPAPIQKRYMIEDLGGNNDFDFNDIVVDVLQASNGTQTAIIRAMGGTLDFTLQIGNTKWSKGTDGLLLDYKVETMYNTKSIKYDAKLAEFPVSGWNFNTNNIVVTVDNLKNDGVKTIIPFPREGDAPMIVAFDPITTHWNEERVPLDEDWYKPL